MEDQLSILKFTLRDGRMFGIDISKLRNIVKISKLNHLPSMSNYILGVMQDRGESIPVIDTSLVLSRGSDKDNLDSRLVLVAEVGDKVYGFVIWGADSILKIKESMISQKFDSSSSCLLSYIINEDDEKMISVIDTVAIINKCTMNNTI